MAGNIHQSEIDKELYSALVDNSVMGLAVIQNRNLIYANKALADIIGQSKDDLLSISPENFISVVHPNDRHVVLEAVINGLARLQLPLHQEFRIFRKDGAILWIDAFANFIEYQGKPAIQVAFLDISRRKLAERELDSTKEQYSHILESISVGFFALDDHFNVTYFNKAAEQLLDRKGSEVIGNNLFEVFPEIKGSIFEDMYTWALKEKRPTNFETYSDKNENWYDVYVYPIENGISVFFQIITERKNAENALRISEERYRHLFESMVRGVVYQEADGKVILANPAAERILGLTLEEMKDGTFLDSRSKAIHENGSDFATDAYPNMIALTTGNLVENIIMGVFNLKDSEYKWLRITAVPEFLPGETKPFQVYTTIEDITEIKKFEDELRIKNESLELSYPLIRADLDGNLKYANKSFLNFWGYGKDEILNRLFHEFFQESQRIDTIMEGVKATGNWSGELIAKRKDGSTFDIQISAHIIEDSVGHPVQLVASFMDITERKWAEVAANESEAKLKELLNLLPIGVYIVGRDGNIVDSNPAFETFMGLTKKELLNREHWKWKYLSSDGTELPPLREDSHHYLPAAITHYSRKPVSNLEIGMVRKGGSTIWANANAVPLSLADWSVVTTIQDITERKRLEKDLKNREERFRRIFDLSPIGIQLFSSDGGLINSNQSSLNILGLKDSKHPKVPNLLRDALEDEEISQRLLTGQIWHDGRWISLKPTKAAKNKKDLPEIPIGTYIDYIITPTGKSGDPEGYIVILQDLTIQKLAQDALISDNERLQIIYELWKTRVKMSEIKMELERKS